MVTYEYDLDVTPGGIPVQVNLNQYDQDYILKFRLYSRNGTLDIRPGTAVGIRGTKRDGNGYSVNAAISGGVVAVSGDQQMTAVAGKQAFELTLTDAGKELNTANFTVNVERAALDKDTLGSESVVRELVNIADRTDEIIAAADKADTAKAEIGRLSEAAVAADADARAQARTAAEAAQSAASSQRNAERDISQAKEAALGEIGETYRANMESINRKGAEIARLTTNADQTAKQALEKASNAENEVAESSNAIESLKKSGDGLRLLLEGKVDGAYVENGYLYLTSSDEVVAGPLGPFSGTGGGSGGSGGNNAELSVTNISGWLSRTVADGDRCEVGVSWSSVEDNMPTGNGTMKVTVNGIVKAVLDIAQGDVAVDVAKYLSVGSNVVKVNVADVYGNNRTVNFSITCIAISVSSTFDASVPYQGAVSFPYTPLGSVQKTVHFFLDGEEIGSTVTSVSGRQMSFAIPQQAHGGHVFECYFDCDVNGQIVRSNSLYYEVIFLEALNDTPVIVSPFNTAAVGQYATVHISYTVYDPSSLTSDVELYVNGRLASRQTVGRTQQVFTYRADDVGDVEVGIVSGSVSKTLRFTVEESDIQVEAETEQLRLYLSSLGRSNNEEEPGTWAYGDTEAVFTEFNYTSDGWQNDADGITVLRVSGDARVRIPYQPFASDCRVTGWTIEVEFATRDIMDYDSPILSCLSGGRGFSFTAQKAVLRSEQSEIYTQYKEDEHVRVAFVVEKRAENRLAYCYINGIMSGAIQYPVDDDFAQAEPQDITIGSNDCTTDIYCIRVYDNSLTRHQILNNWIADTQTVDDMLSRYRRNGIYDEYGNIVAAQLPTDLPYLILECRELPQYKGDKKTVSGSYVDPVVTSRSFTFEGAQADVQGTSSQYYARKNYKIKFKGGFTLDNGTQSPAYKMRPDSIGTSTFTFKADVASSEGANNVELVRLYNDACPYRMPPQRENSAVRQGIDGFPIVIFWDNGEETVFLGKYNFNNDKGTPEVFGFAEGDESWEIRNNTSDRVLWKSDDFTGTDWQNDFEARFPEDNADASRLAALSAWLRSTDQDAVPTEAEKAARLQRFKEELPLYMEKDAVLFYYLFTELFLMVDSRAKNAFPTAYLSGGGKWFSLPYDFDTAVGINNEGALVFGYSLEDIDQTDGGADVFNGQRSVLWVNLRQAFYDDIRAMYQGLRSTGKLSYQDTERRFEEHQSKWPEAVFNEDAWFKYLAPLVESGSAAYLSMLQGSKAEQRKWWLYNRFRYLDSKYNAGDALTDVITVRGYAKSDVTVTPYADVYASVKYGSYLVQERAMRNTSHTLACPLDNVNDTEIYIYSASQLASVGDLSGLMVGYAEFSMATRLQSLKLGDASESYSNGNLTELYLGNNVLLRSIDVRNCPNLMQALDLSGCVNIEEIYLTGTSIPGILLPNGGILKRLHLPETITNLTIRNQAGIMELSMPSYANISTLRLENVGDLVDSKAMVQTIQAGSRVRVLGFSWEAENADEIFSLMDVLDGMRGLDENGNNMDQAQLSGTVHTESLTGAELLRMQQRYPYITVAFEHITSSLNYYSYDGKSLLHTETVSDVGNGRYSGRPSRSSTAQHTYTFAGWSRTPGGAADADAVKAVTADRNVYAAYTENIRKYTVYFYNEDTLLQTVRNVSYGGDAEYTEAVPLAVDGPAEEYPFMGWNPTGKGITGDTKCYAQFGSPLEIKEITDPWDAILAACADGTYAEKYKIGNYKPLDLGDEGIIRMQIAARDKDALADGPGTAHFSWIGMELLKTAKRMNPAHSAYVEPFIFVKDESLGEEVWKSTIKGRQSKTCKASWTIVIPAPGMLSVRYRVSSEKNYDKLTLKVDGATVANAVSGDIAWTDHEVECTEGQTIIVTAVYSKDHSVDTGDDAAYVSFGGIPGLSITQTESAGRIPASGGTVGGWGESEMRAYLEQDILPLIPANVRASIKEVEKGHPAYDQCDLRITQTSQDGLWMPSYDEMSSKGIYRTVFVDNASKVKKLAGAETASKWWLRSANNDSSFYCIGTSGSSESSNANGALGVPLCFCL